MLSSGAPYLLRDRVMADPSLVGQTMTISAPLADPIDQFHKGIIPRDVTEDQRRVSDEQIGYYDQHGESGRISAPCNWTLFTAADRRSPEMAGHAGALGGAFYGLPGGCPSRCAVGSAAANDREEE